jgi:hypothetical protein
MLLSIACFPSVAEAIVVDVFINKGTSIQQQEKVPLPALRSTSSSFVSLP